jgi:2-polyprenyl-6-methoxyphenol hydroxylase-like FAD-dependent oxidoreductase
MSAVNTENRAVLVAGGGPAGLAAAAELSLHGVGCVVIEPRAEVSHRRPRAKTSSVRTMEHMRRWGLADAVRAAAPLKVAWSQRVTFCESLTGKRIVDFDGAFGLTTERDDRFAEPGQQVPQPVVEEVLRAHLASRPGTELRLGHAVTGLREDAGGVTVTVRSAGTGGTYQIRADYVLGCDGYGGVTRDCLGAAYAGTSDPRPNFNVVFRAPGFDPPLGPAVQYWTVTAATQGLAGRLDLDGTWWAIMPGVSADYGTAHAADLITGLAGAPVRHELLASDPWTARMLVADRFCSRRVFLVGESAHVNPPYGGHGYNTSIGDAVNIAWKLAFVLRGWAGPRLLESYEPERRGVVEETVASAAANLRALPADLAADAAAIRRAKSPEFYNLGLVLGYRYAGSPVVQPGGDGSPVADVGRYTPSAEPGARLPHWWLPDGRSLYDTLGTGFTLVGPADVGDERVCVFSERARALRLPLTVAVTPPDYPWHGEFLLVRPDQHIAWRADDPAGIDLAAAAGLLAGLRGRVTYHGQQRYLTYLGGRNRPCPAFLTRATGAPRCAGYPADLSTCWSSAAVSPARARRSTPCPAGSGSAVSSPVTWRRARRAGRAS